MHVQDLQQAVETYIRARRARLILEGEVDKLKAIESAHKEGLLIAMQEAEMSEISGPVGGVRRHVGEEPKAKDWEKVYAFIREHNAFDLLQKRLSDPAVRLRREDGIEIPGIEMFPVEKLTVFGENIP